MLGDGLRLPAPKEKRHPEAPNSAMDLEVEGFWVQGLGFRGLGLRGLGRRVDGHQLCQIPNLESDPLRC